jgi:hypothetical protein
MYVLDVEVDERQRLVLTVVSGQLHGPTACLITAVEVSVRAGPGCPPPSDTSGAASAGSGMRSNAPATSCKSTSNCPSR